MVEQKDEILEAIKASLPPVNGEGAFYSFIQNTMLKAGRDLGWTPETFVYYIMVGFIQNLKHTVKDMDKAIGIIPTVVDMFREEYANGITGFHASFNPDTEFHLEEVWEESTAIHRAIKLGRTKPIEFIEEYDVEWMTPKEREIFEAFKEEEKALDAYNAKKYAREDLQEFAGYTVTDKIKEFYSELKFTYQDWQRARKILIAVNLAFILPTMRWDIDDMISRMP